MQPLASRHSFNFFMNSGRTGVGPGPELTNRDARRSRWGAPYAVKPSAEKRSNFEARMRPLGVVKLEELPEATH